MKVKINESGNIETLCITDPILGCSSILDLISKADDLGSFSRDEIDDIWSCNQETFEWWQEYLHSMKEANKLSAILSEQFGVGTINSLISKAIEGTGFNDLPYSIIEALGEFEDSQDGMEVQKSLNNSIVSCIASINAGWMKDIAGQLSELHAAHGYPDISTGPNVDIQPLSCRNYDEATEVDIEWFDNFYTGVENLQKCLDIRVIDVGQTVTSDNSSAAFIAYRKAASKLIVDWLSNKAWDDYCKAH